MASNIILKDSADANVTFVPRNTQGNQVLYVAAGTSLLDVKRLELTLKDNGPTNRVVGKLSIPTAGANPQTGLQGVQWTEIGSFDLSSVKVASTDAAEDFFALWASFAGHDAVKTMFVDGVRA